MDSLLTKYKSTCLALITILCSGCQDAAQTARITEVFQPPEFSGEFEVATSTFHWLDETREESFTEVTDDRREISVRLYYPTDKSAGYDKLALLPHNFEQYYLDYSPVDEQTLDLSHFESQSWPIAVDASLSDKQQQYPLIVFSHGYYFLPEMHSFLAGELASYGYIVASINHTYGSSYARLQDGTITGAIDHPEEDFGAYHETWAKDQLFTLEKVRELASSDNSAFKDSLSDFVAIVGHSYGGSSGYHAATMSNEIDAVVNLDGRIFDLENTSVVTPFMYVHSESESQSEAFEHIDAQGYSVVFAGMHHVSFSDLPLYWQWDFPRQSFFGDMPHQNPQQVVVETILAFFESLNNPSKVNQLMAIKNDALKIDVIAYPKQ